jgi:hypothetical protein
VETEIYRGVLIAVSFYDVSFRLSIVENSPALAAILLEAKSEPSCGFLTMERIKRYIMK